MRNGPDDTPGDHLSRFRHALRHTPIPSSPPPHDSYLEALGLNLLALALRLEHIDRMSESLTLADSTHMTRSVAIDVDLGALTPDQRRALRTDPTGTGEPTAVWLPIARHARTDLAPMLVRNGADQVVPRATVAETGRALSHGMAKAFRMFLDSAPRRAGTRTLHDTLHTHNRSRWLIEATIAGLIDNGGFTTGPRTPPVRPHRDATASDSIRDLAEEAVLALFDADSPFLRLLDIAASEHLLVVEVPTSASQVFLTFNGQVMPARAQERRGVETPSWASLQNEFTVRYQTVIPRAVNSYHVAVVVPDEIQVRRFVLTSDVDRPALRSLVQDMRVVAEQYDELAEVSDKLLELELQGIASRLAEFGRRRYRDLEYYAGYLADYYASFSNRKVDLVDPTAAEPTTAANVLDDDPRLVTQLAKFAQFYETDSYRKLTEDTTLTPDVLRRLADHLEQSEVDKDIYVDNDPRENAAHAHWTRRPFGTESQSVEPVTVSVYVALVDDPPSLASDVAKLLLAVVLLVLGFGAVLQPGLFEHVPLLGSLGRVGPAQNDAPLSSADAVVTMLLLVPGLLLSRLDIPSNKTVLGRLRTLPRYIAYLAVITASGLAIAVASTPVHHLRIPFLVASVVLFALVGLVVADSLSKAAKRRVPVPNNQVVPMWLLREAGPRRRRARRRCAVNFSPIGPDATEHPDLGTGG